MKQIGEIISDDGVSVTNLEAHLRMATANLILLHMQQTKMKERSPKVRKTIPIARQTFGSSNFLETLSLIELAKLWLS